jgi:uncharacterized protein (DUF736 family)
MQRSIRIGSFRRSGRDFYGEIITLSVQARDVCIASRIGRQSRGSALYSVKVGEANIGVAQPDEEGSGRLKVYLDDPTFTQPIHAVLEPSGDGTFSLLWLRG